MCYFIWILIATSVFVDSSGGVCCETILYGDLFIVTHVCVHEQLYIAVEPIVPSMFIYTVYGRSFGRTDKTSVADDLSGGGCYQIMYI